MAKWGTKTWAVSPKKVLALEGLTFAYTQAADNNSSTEEKKTTNERGMDLFSLSFSTVLHSGAGVDVRDEIESWKKLVTQVDYLYLGGKKLGPKLQLRKVSVSNVKIDDLGRMRLATLSFEFKEYDPDTTSVKVSTSALSVKASAESKSQKKPDNVQIEQLQEKPITIGTYVQVVGDRDIAGETITEKEKERSYSVSKINESQNKALLSGIDKWVYLNDVTMI
ncbi:MAG TPA: hypothetical protein IAB44_12105 [Candidatus Limivivens intestinipullorum]|uniref:Uncharacterized protein n=1 Tax=Candidatus Limivivens intestinipullorum TaxID=2840858 RepID=A0A9D1JL06_9FIRM|nr:hypothetical protein [Candidatus Limivivens intestinipullorum]